MKKWNHAFDIAFSLVTTKPLEEITPNDFRKALLERIIELDDENTWLEAIGNPFDTFEEA